MLQCSTCGCRWPATSQTHSTCSVHACTLHPVHDLRKRRRPLLCCAEYECGKWWGRRPPRNAMTNLLTLRGGPAMRPFALKVLGWWHWKVCDRLKSPAPRVTISAHWNLEAHEDPRAALSPGPRSPSRFVNRSSAGRQFCVSHHSMRISAAPGQLTCCSQPGASFWL